MDDYKIALGALLDANAKGDIDKQLNAIKDLSVTISKATLNNDVINDIKRQLTQNGIDLKLVFGNVGQITNQAKQTGQQIGQQIQSGINSAIQKGNLQKDFFFSADKKNGVAKKAQEYFRGISNGVVTVTEQMENLDDKSELRGFIVNIKNAKGEVESLKYSLRNILDDNGNVTGQKFAYVSGSINDAGAIKQFEELNKVITDYEIKLANLKTKYSNANVDYSAFNNIFDNFKVGIGTTNDLALAFNQLENSAKKGVQSLKSQSSSFDPIQQTLNNMRDLPSMLTTLEANMSGIKDKTSIDEISVSDLRKAFSELETEMTNSGGKVPLTDEWLVKYKELMSTVTSATKQVDALKKAEASDNSQATKQANYYSSILASYRQMYDIKKKLLTAGEEEAKVLELQRKSFSASIASNYKQLGSQSLTDKDWQSQVDDLKKSQEYQLNLTKARISDKNATQEQTQAQREYNNALKEQEVFQKNINDIKLSFDNGLGDSKYGNRIQELENQFVKYGMSVDEAKQKTANLRTILDGFKVDGNFLPDDELIAQENKLKKVFWAIKTSVDSAKLSFDKFLQPVSSEKASSLIIRINDFLSKNKNITKEANEELEKYVRLLQNGNVNLNDWNKFNNRLKEINVEMREAGRLGKTLKQTLIDGAKSFAQWTISSVSVMEVVQAFKKMFNAVVEVDSAMIELTKVSNASSSDLKNYFDGAAENAKDLGVTVSDVISVTADWSRLGYNLPDSKQLAEVATLYKNVGDGIDIDTANESLVSTLQGFKLNAEDAMHIVDSFNEVANRMPIDSAGIGEALQRSASSMYAAGNTLEETIGLVTAANAVVQDPDSVGTAYKTISMRIRGAKTEMEALGLETDGMVESTATLQKEILALTGVDIMKDENTFKSTYAILDELAIKWSDLTDIQQASVTELIAGKRQGNIVSALMNNFEMARESTQIAVDSTGSALREQENYEKGIQYSLDRMSASWQEFSNHFIDSSFVKGIVDFGNTAINIIDDVTSSLGTLGTIGLIGGGILGGKNLG